MIASAETQDRQQHPPDADHRAPTTAAAGTSCRPPARWSPPIPAATDFTEEMLARTWRWPTRPSRTCSSAPAASSASPTSCCGSSPTPSCISPIPTGPTFDADALDAAIASYQQRERRFGRTGAQAGKQEATLMLKTRVITAVVLLAVLLPVLFFNDFAAFARGGRRCSSAPRSGKASACSTRRRRRRAGHRRWSGPRRFAYAFFVARQPDAARSGSRSAC